MISSGAFLFVIISRKQLIDALKTPPGRPAYVNHVIIQFERRLHDLADSFTSPP